MCKKTAAPSTRAKKINEKKCTKIKNEFTKHSAPLGFAQKTSHKRSANKVRKKAKEEPTSAQNNFSTMNNSKQKTKQNKKRGAKKCEKSAGW